MTFMLLSLELMSSKIEIWMKSIMDIGTKFGISTSLQPYNKILS